MELEVGMYCYNKTNRKLGIGKIIDFQRNNNVDNEIGVFNSDFQIEFFPIENLRGILTHEQMEQMAYKVGE